MSITVYENNNSALSALEIQELVGVFELLLKWDQAMPVIVDLPEDDCESSDTSKMNLHS